MDHSDLLGSGRTLGLSGDAARVLPPGPGLATFDQFLLRHHTTTDLMADPVALWDGPARAGRCGLRSHLLREQEGHPRPYTDALLIVSQPDWARAASDGSDEWALSVRQMLRERYYAWSITSGLPSNSRPVDFAIRPDGGAWMGGAALGLRAGDFVTGLLPNFHLGRETTSRPLYDLMAYAPGQPRWTHLATVYADQRLLTVGNHWLDNARIDGLSAAALYQLRCSAKGELTHLIHPEFRATIRVETRTNRSGQPVLVLRSANGKLLVYLAVTAARATDTLLEPGRLLDEVTLQDARLDHDPLERIQTLDEPELGAPPRSLDPPQLGSAQGVEPTTVETRILTLRERGALLQTVHFAKFMEGYDVAVGADGAVASRLPDPVAHIEVRGRHLALRAVTFGVKIGGRALDAGEHRAIEGNQTLHLPGATLEIRDLRRVDAEGWPYLAEIRRDGEAVHAVFGGRLRVGRSRRCRVRLPDDPWNDNIRWRAEVAEGDHIRSRNGALPKSQFYLDAIMVAAEHAEIDLTREPLLHALSRGCYTFIRRGRTVLSVPPVGARSGAEGSTPSPNLDLRSGDEILVGNCVLEVDYPPASQPRPARPPPLDVGPLRATDLAGTVSIDDSLLSRPLPRVTRAPRAGDLPVAAGLGEKGPAPLRPTFSVSRSEDSLELPLHPPPPAAPAPANGVRVVRDERVSVELSQPVRLELLGWQLPFGRAWRLGNHEDADLVLPELSTAPGQRFTPTDHFRIHAKKTGIEVVPTSATGCRFWLPARRSDSPRLQIDRHDASDQVDFVVELTLQLDPGQPALLRLDRTSRATLGLVSFGLSRGGARSLRLGKSGAVARVVGDAVDLTWGRHHRVLGDGERVVIDQAVYRVSLR